MESQILLILKPKALSQNQWFPNCLSWRKALYNIKFFLFALLYTAKFLKIHLTANDLDTYEFGGTIRIIALAMHKNHGFLGPMQERTRSRVSDSNTCVISHVESSDLQDFKLKA